MAFKAISSSLIIQSKSRDHHDQVLPLKSFDTLAGIPGRLSPLPRYLSPLSAYGLSSHLHPDER